MKKKRKKHVKAGEPQTVTRAVTHIRLQAANSGKLAALDQVASEFLALAQRYVTLFCSEEFPDKFRAPCFSTALSERWHRVAIQKAKLRACLQKRGVPSDKLPSTTSRTGQRLMRHVKQEINRAVKRCFLEHEGSQFAYEQLSVATMRYKARAMNAYMRASNLGHIPNQIAWNATKRGVAATQVKSAYSSQECHVCHYVDRKNRPTQQTFCCRVCSHRTHADENAAHNIASRLGDRELRACAKRDDIKALLLKRHEQWKQTHRLTVVEPPVQLGLWDSSKTSTDVG